MLIIIFMFPEFVLSHSGFPLNRPKDFTIELQWLNDEGTPTNLSLSLAYSQSANNKVPLLTDDGDGKPKITGVAKLRVREGNSCFGIAGAM